MPLLKPSPEESQNEFVSRCISFAVREGMPQEQATAACFTQWRRRNLEEDSEEKESNPLEGVNVEDVREAKPYEGVEGENASDILKEKVSEWLK